MSRHTITKKQRRKNGRRERRNWFINMLKELAKEYNAVFLDNEYTFFTLCWMYCVYALLVLVLGLCLL
ncbi:MAG: hypothetical protein ACKD6O_08115 [Candidatus Bathyarchaeota archaeon]